MEMNFMEFAEAIREMASSEYGADNTRIDNILKTNDVSLKALIITEPTSNIFPTLYLESHYDDYKAGKDIGDIYEDLKEAYNKYRIDNPINADCLKDWDKMRSKVTFRVINAEKNENLLRDIPWRPCLDLAVVYHISFDAPEDTVASSLIHNSHMETWNVSEEDLWQAANESVNTLCEPNLKSLFDFLSDIAGMEPPEEMKEGNPLRVCTNRQRTHGACIPFLNTDFRNQVSKDFSDSFKGAFILPSSIHECMLLMDDGSANAGELKNLVIEVNHTQVSEPEVLSDSVYYLDFATNEISIAA